MGYRCSRCNNNWSRLHVEDDHENDEQYECCPLCGTDMFLTLDENDKANLVWMPVVGREPLPVGFCNAEQYRQHQIEVYMKENNLTLEQYRQLGADRAAEREQEAANRRKAISDALAEKERERIRQEDAYIAKHYK